ncbi:DUF7527 domain-containing protein [Haloplanus halophilus]|uniref:DUF7527 domain-containing protein n=1 Tax=Haloplanus halophilus TaxID=2949993 RepID=UPI00203DBCEB|nr:hypothetical protein [Haloplanus sp. GDY1]
MDGEILDAVTEWGTRPVSDGVTGLYDLADDGFSGAVTDGSAWAFVLNGRYVGVFDGDIDDFEDASLTAYTAPDVSLPLLFAMQARGGETRGQYYSNETPLTEIDDTLSAGNFVGYVELSENVLSGDYYVVYYGGRSLPVAYVGNSRRLLTGEEAFERAADEVGIYSVVDADVEVIDLPERPEPADDAGDAGAAAAGGAAAASGDADVDGGAVEDVAFGGATETEDPADGDGSSPEAFDAGATATEGPASDDETTGTDPTDADGGSPSADWATPEVAEPDEADADEAEATAEDADAATAGATTAGSDDADATSAVDGGATAGGDGVADEAGAVTTEDVQVGSAEDARAEDAPDGTDEADPADGTDEADPADETPASASSADAATADRVARLRRELDAVRAEKEELETERDSLERERDELRATVDRLQDRVEELEAEIQRLEDGEGGVAGERTLTREEALSGTNLFVRYEDKTEGTLERAAKGRIDESTLRANLRLDYHTEFETAGLAVDGQPFEAFLRGTPEHRFVEWLLTAVTYEIRQTDTRAELSKLYEAIERIDRIDLGGGVDVTTEEERDDRSVSFDVVFRDKMGEPLFVAAMEDGREPTSASAIESLLDRSKRVSDAEENFAAAFFVTTSYFDADAMEVAVDATRGGLFSRSSRRSYVKLSRKSGFHLCLVEARDEDFFLSVPDL